MSWISNLNRKTEAYLEFCFNNNFARRVRFYSLFPIHLVVYLLDCLVERWLTPEVQKKIPWLNSRVKVLSSTKLAIITSSGNRLEYLKVCLPTWLAQRHLNFEVIVSVYADTQGTAQYIRNNFSRELNSGKLKIIETNADIFNKARALNIAVRSTDAEYFLMIDCDFIFVHVNCLEAIVRYFNRFSIDVLSIGACGQVFTNRNRFIEIGGIDTTLGDLWAPEDIDYIIRYLTYFKASYILLCNGRYMLLISVKGGQFKLKTRYRMNKLVAEEVRKRAPSQNLELLFKSKYYQRIGGRAFDMHKTMRLQYEYFKKNSPKIKLKEA